MPLRIGDTFAGYRILRLLGSGGMGEVYVVQHPRLPRQDALKVVRLDVCGDTSFRERFIREADLVAGLRHPHIVGIHDRGEYNDQLWIAMDYIDGTDAAQLMQQRYPAGMPAALKIHGQTVRRASDGYRRQSMSTLAGSMTSQYSRSRFNRPLAARRNRTMRRARITTLNHQRRLLSNFQSWVWLRR